MNMNPQKIVLIVDDTPANLHLLIKILKQSGYKTRPMPNGARALLSVRKNPPDLILLDIMMPGIDGYEVCQQLKADEATRDIPVIFLSALNEVMDKIKAFEVGGVDYITKPFQAEEVLARVETHIALRDMQKQLQQEITERKQAEEALQIAYNRMQEELAFAQEIQYGLFLAPQPDWSDIKVCCYSSPASEVGGDFYVYHAFELPVDLQSDQETGGYMVAVGDASGKGMSAALIMSVSLVLLQATFQQKLSPQNY